ncbi:acyltransferase family protein [Longimicrobium sp.]|uniref:acyltransferase family protein n=1 Tax=Longimicrobium sp. TaxID=2029185 RepID=UPI002EDAAFC7
MAEPAPNGGHHSRGEWRFRPDIEGLRAIAILAVVLYHAGVPNVPAGYLGVDVFFVLSGFLISGILLSEAATGTISLRAFWARRARRLLPAAAVLILAVLAVDAVLASPTERMPHAQSAVAASLYASNILFALRSRLYFGAESGRDPLLHTWSLGVEEQFYLLFAPLVLFLVMRGGAAGLRRRFAVVVGAGTIVSFGLCLAAAREAPAWAFYLLPTRAWEFGAGALCALAVGGRSRGARRWEVVAGLGAAGLIGAMLLDPGGTSLSHPGTATLLPVLATVAIILAGGTGSPPRVSRVLARPSFRLLGRLSYSWYLWHWPALVFLELEVPAASAGLRLAVAAAALLPAALTYALVENPVRYHGAFQRRPGLAIVGAALLTVILSGAACAAGALAERAYRSPRMAAVREAGRKPDREALGCKVLNAPVLARECGTGAGDGPLLVLFGDSHVGHWLPAFIPVAERRGWRLLMVTRGGCTAPSVTVLLRVAPLSGNRDCDAWRAAALRWIASQRPHVVVLSSSRDRTIHVGGDRYLAADSTGDGRRRWAAGLRHTVEQVLPSGARVVVVQDTPLPGFDVPDCIARHLDRPEQCDVPAARAVDHRLARAEREAIAGLQGVSYIDMTPAICGPRVCRVYVDGVIRFRDTDHLSTRFAAALAPRMDAALDGGGLR